MRGKHPKPSEVKKGKIIISKLLNFKDLLYISYSLRNILFASLSFSPIIGLLMECGSEDEVWIATPTFVRE